MDVYDVSVYEGVAFVVAVLGIAVCRSLGEGVKPVRALGAHI
jgi:hypothetical protein